MPDQKHVGGRPLKFDSVEELECRINAYFDECDKEEDTRVWSHDEIVTEGKRKVCCLCRRPERSRGCMLVSGTLKKRRPYTVTGLAVWLDTSRQTLLDYEVRPEFLDTIKRAKQKIENYAEEKLFDGDYPTRGVIFSLSNNAKGWSEKKEETLTVKKDSAADLAKAVFDEEEMEEDTAVDEFDSPASTAPAPESHLASDQAQTVQEDEQDAEPVPEVV